jgi:hypothetical protein
MEDVLRRRLKDMIDLGIEPPASAELGPSVIDQEDDAPLAMRDGEEA